MPDAKEDIRNFDIPNPFRPRALLDFEFCADRVELAQTLRAIDRNGYAFLCATQDGESYTVFFRRPAP